MHIAEQRNSSGKHSFKSILDIPDDVIIHRASRLGVSLADNAAKTSCSVNLIKRLESERSLVILQNNLSKGDELSDSSLFLSKASNLA